MLLRCGFNIPFLPNSYIKVTRVCDDLKNTCSASVASVRGKTKYIYEYTVSLEWEAVLLQGQKCTGILKFQEVDESHQIGNKYEITKYTIGKDTPEHCKFMLENYVRDG